jgi:signal transduction histidine kinase
MFAVIIYIFVKSNLMMLKRLEQISNNVDSVISGNYEISVGDIEEGILSKINTQFYQMSRIVQMNFTKIRDEKENIKILITDISHQLKTPLASIKMYNSILIEDEDITKNEKNEFLETSKKEINKLEWLIGSLVKLSRLEAGMIELKVDNNPIGKTIRDAVESINAKAKEKNINIVTDIDIDVDEKHYILHDYRWTKEAIVNVLENAVKYSSENEKIKIHIVPMNSYIRIDIEDNGIGIPKKDFNNIFKRFFRGDSEIVKVTEGSGVGLYLTRKILENQGGSITVDSVINKGTTFSLFLRR